MSMIDVEQPRKRSLAVLYRNQFLRCSPELDASIVDRLAHSPVLLVRERCTMGLGEDRTNMIVETLLEQRRPWAWRLHGHRVATASHSVHDALRRWSADRLRALGVPGGPSLIPVYRFIADALTHGQEGVDWAMQHSTGATMAA